MELHAAQYRCNDEANLGGVESISDGGTMLNRFSALGVGKRQLALTTLKLTGMALIGLTVASCKQVVDLDNHTVLDNCSDIEEMLSSSDRFAGAIWTAEQNAYMRQSPDSSAPGQPLPFGTPLSVSDVSKDWFKVSTIGLDTTGPVKTGWVHAGNLFCRSRVEENYREQAVRFLAVPDAGKPVTLFQTRAGDACANCDKITGSTPLYVFDLGASQFDFHGRALVSDVAFMHADRGPLGWVNKSEGVAWRTSLGIRPATNLEVYPDIQPGEVCLYPTADSARQGNSAHCTPLPHDPAWRSTPFRLPVLDVFQPGDENGTTHGPKIYKVWVPKERPVGFEAWSPMAEEIAFVRHGDPFILEGLLSAREMRAWIRFVEELGVGFDDDFDDYIARRNVVDQGLLTGIENQRTLQDVFLNPLKNLFAEIAIDDPFAKGFLVVQEDFKYLPFAEPQFSNVMKVQETNLINVEACERARLKSWIELSFEILEFMEPGLAYPRVSEGSNLAACHTGIGEVFPKTRLSLEAMPMGEAVRYRYRTDHGISYWIDTRIIP